MDGEFGVNVIKSPVKLVILEMLREHEMEFDEIVSNTGKSKSTISVHLKALRETGIISYKMDPEDNRKKIFYLTSRYLGSVEGSDSSDIEETKADFLIKRILEESNNFPLLLFHTLRSMLIQEGISLDPILYHTGKKMGEALFSKLYDENLDVFVENIKQFWQENGLGKLTIDLGQIIKITSLDCFECEFLPKTGKPACYLDTGIFESLFRLYFQMPVNVTEVKCYTMDDGHCMFEVEPASL